MVLSLFTDACWLVERGRGGGALADDRQTSSVLDKEANKDTRETAVLISTLKLYSLTINCCSRCI